MPPKVQCNDKNVFVWSEHKHYWKVLTETDINQQNYPSNETSEVKLLSLVVGVNDDSLISREGVKDSKVALAVQLNTYNVNATQFNCRNSWAELSHVGAIGVNWP